MSFAMKDPFTDVTNNPFEADVLRAALPASTTQADVELSLNMLRDITFAARAVLCAAYEAGTYFKMNAQTCNALARDSAADAIQTFLDAFGDTADTRDTRREINNLLDGEVDSFYEGAQYDFEYTQDFDDGFDDAVFAYAAAAKVIIARAAQTKSKKGTDRKTSAATSEKRNVGTGDGSDDGDPEPAAHPVKNKKNKKPLLEVLAAAAADLGIAPVRAAEDPDPNDLVIPDPCKTDPRVLAHGDTSRTRYIRKAISAAKGHHTGRAADFYTAQAIASLQRMIRLRLNDLDIYPAPTELVEQAATSLLLGLVKEHNFSRIPNPNLYNLVSKNVKNRANLREVASRTREKGQTGVDLLDVEAGLVRPKGPLPEVVLDYYSADLDPRDPADKAHRAYALEAQQRMSAGPQPAECPAITSDAHRVHAREVLEVLEYAARAVPTTNAEDDFGFDDPLDDLVSGNAMDDPFLHTWAQELVDQGQMPAVEDDPDGDVRRAIDACALMTLKVEKVLLMVAALSDEAVQARAPAIFKAMACVEGCDTAQHRADLLRTRARNHRGAFSPAIQQAAASLLKGAGYSL